LADNRVICPTSALDKNFNPRNALKNARRNKKPVISSKAKNPFIAVLLGLLLLPRFLFGDFSPSGRNDKKKFLPVISNERSEEKSLNYCPVVIVSAAKNPFKQKKLIVTTRLYSIGYFFFSQPIRYVLFPINNNIN
jgi:hypothetical protein